MGERHITPWHRLCLGSLATLVLITAVIAPVRGSLFLRNIHREHLVQLRADILRDRARHAAQVSPGGDSSR
jgi:hypothetical protein